MLWSMPSSWVVKVWFSFQAASYLKATDFRQAKGTKMTDLNFVVMSLAAVCLAACGSQSPSGQAKDRGGGEVVASAEENLAAEGSGIFGLDCEAATGRYEIILSEGDDGFVSAQVTGDSGRFEDLLTSYSYMGDATPTDFLIAIMFDPTNAPVPDSDDPRIEIWKGENAYYALVNGNEDERLDYCSDVPG